MASSDTTLIIKNPSRSNQHFSISFRLDGTIAELQKLLGETYEGHPAPADQTLIYGGKVLKDSSVRLRDIVSKHDAPEGPHSIHLVVKQKSPTALPSPARSVDSSASASVSRPALSSLNTAPAASGSAARPIPAPTRTVPAPPATSAASTAGPNSSLPGDGPAVATSSAAPQSDTDELEATASSFLNTWTALSGVAGGGLYGAGAYGCVDPFAVPRPQAAEANPAAAGQEGAAGAAAPTAAAGVVPTASTVPCVIYNPIIGGVYQAAYSAALAALSVAAQQQGQHQQGQQPVPLAPQPEQPVQQEATAGGQLQDQGAAAAGEAAPAVEGADNVAAGPAVAAASVAAAQGAQQFAYVPVFVPAYGQVGYPFGMPGFYPFPPQLAAVGARQNLWQQRGAGAAGGAAGAGAGAAAGGGGVDPDLMDLTALLDTLEGRGIPVIRRQGGRAQEGAGGGGAVRAGQAGIRLRRGQMLVLGGPHGPLAAAAGGDDQPAAARNRAGVPWRPRVFTIRISARALLQALVFAIVLYQHFTWRRFLALLIGGAILFITSTWAPLRRLMRGLHAPPPRPPAGAGAGGAGLAAAAAGPAAAGAAGVGAGAGPAAGAEGAAAQGAAGAAQQAAAAAQPQEAPRRGFFHEILVFVVGFITSLLPAWNFNPEDAAAFAAAQEMVAVEERARQQQEAGAAAGDREAAPEQGAPAAGGEAPGAGEARGEAAAAAAAAQ